MKKKKILYILIVYIFLCFPITVFADRCSNEEKIAFASLAKNISVTYDYIEQNNQVSFNIILTNLQPGLKIKDVMNNREYYYSSSELILYGYQPGNNYRFDVYSYSCDSKLYSHYVTLPGYNKYYSDPVCNEVNASVCQKWITINYDYDTFVKEVNKYKIQKIEKPIEENKEVLGIYYYIINFFVKYYYIVLPIIIIICSVIIYIQRKKDSLL